VATVVGCRFVNVQLGWLDVELVVLRARAPAGSEARPVRAALSRLIPSNRHSSPMFSRVAHLRWDLRQIFRMAVNDGVLQRNPAELLHTPCGTVHEKPVLTHEQAILALNALDVRERLILKLAGTCGMRPGEIVALQWQDINKAAPIFDNGNRWQKKFWR
jgi:integrase